MAVEKMKLLSITGKDTDLEKFFGQKHNKFRYTNRRCKKSI